MSLNLTVADCMVQPRLILTPDTSITKAVEQMLAANVIGAAVVDEQQKVIGYISEQDCLRFMIADSYYVEERGMVRDVMKPDVLFAEPDMSVLDLAQLMCGSKPKKYPVCKDGKLVGVITRSDVLKALVKAAHTPVRV